MRLDARAGAVALAIGACLTVTFARPLDARAFCRTTACPLPSDFSPTDGACTPSGFEQYCASLMTPAKPLPVWWRSACVSYDLQKNASRQVTYGVASEMMAAAFAQWTSVTCDDGSGVVRPISIAVQDFGPVDCDEVNYNKGEANQHVIIFRDDVWPHNDANNTLGLTTVTFDPDTGEIFDADMEINATVTLSTDPMAVPAGGYDLLSIVTHEAGHFLGMAHSGDTGATMYAHYTAGSMSMRNLTSDDTAGLCSIYPPDLLRIVDPSVAPQGTVHEDVCDPTPRHGFQSACSSPAMASCAVAIPGSRRGGSWAVFAGAALALGRFARRRRTSQGAAPV